MLVVVVVFPLHLHLPRSLVLFILNLLLFFNSFGCLSVSFNSFELATFARNLQFANWRSLRNDARTAAAARYAIAIFAVLSHFISLRFLRIHLTY